MRSRLDYVALLCLGVVAISCACSRKVEPKEREWFCGPSERDTCLCGHSGVREAAHECTGRYDCCFFYFSLEKGGSTCECWNLGGKFGNSCASYHPKEVHFPDAWRRSCP